MLKRFLPFALFGSLVLLTACSSTKKEEKTIVDKLKFWKGEDGKTDPAKQYRIKVVENENGTTRVNVVDADDKRNRSSTANRIISLLYDQLK